MSHDTDQTPEEQVAPFYTPENFVPDEAIAYLMRRIINSIQSQIEQSMEPYDLTAMQWLPLFILDNGTASTSAELARRMQVDTGAVTRMVDRMEHKGLIRRVRSVEDRRVVNLEVTAAGRESARVIPEALCTVLNDHIRGFTSEEVVTLTGFLHRILLNGEAGSGGSS
ncbi:MarR family winged helix-turn-helix transcriptional regulator [Granulosicoccus antarcticus]|uniref:Putative HTH-type transcriptional regulator YusO n=1 Tax=Granulosicoccus antarcticus IMCC3135 TaxID=1192854 RepID=A0A2Z2NT36_9GAMM|nr:MarR family transcriptional regulator [Granulosicoccus antarcticus]ASJ74712.1 putative HTH-type transcriptional regulator YusO [Granulosicoccus antarcticus IMCC3135]